MVRCLSVSSISKTNVIIDRGIRLWIDDNVNTLYKSVVTPMSTILNRFKKCAQDLVENVYGLDTSIWTDKTVRANHNKTTVDFLTGQGSLNFIFGDIVRVNIFSWETLLFRL